MTKKISIRSIFRILALPGFLTIFATFFWVALNSFMFSQTVTPPPASEHLFAPKGAEIVTVAGLQLVIPTGIMLLVVTVLPIVAGYYFFSFLVGGPVESWLERKIQRTLVWNSILVMLTTPTLIVVGMYLFASRVGVGTSVYYSVLGALMLTVPIALFLLLLEGIGELVRYCRRRGIIFCW